MDRTKFFLAIVLSAAVIIGWQVVMRRFYPSQGTDEPPQLEQPVQRPPAQPPQSEKSAVPAPDKSSKPQASGESAGAQKAESTQAPEREITLDTPYWTVRFNSRGAVATSWILKNDKKPNGVD